MLYFQPGFYDNVTGYQLAYCVNRNKRKLAWSEIMIEGLCPKCGKRYWGWSLKNPRYQSCRECGSGLSMSENGKQIINDYSPFTADEHKLNPFSKFDLT
jgi:DNA-directed RNA polymerase subunit RPC12/RpoP